MSDFQRFLQEQLKDPVFREMWKQYEQMKARVLAGEMTWEELNAEMDRSHGSGTQETVPGYCNHLLLV